MIRPGTLLRWNVLKDIFKSELKDGMTILDIGSFDGFASNKLTHIFPNLELILLDLDESGLQLAKKNKLKALYASATNLPIQDGTIDYVICLDLIEHVDDDKKVITEISRVLKQNAKVILTTPKENGVNFPLLSRKKTEEINLGWGHIRPGYAMKDIDNMFSGNGLKIEKKCGYFNLLTRLVYPFVMNSISNNFVLALYKVILTFESIIKYKTDEHIIVAKKI